MKSWLIYIVIWSCLCCVGNNIESALPSNPEFDALFSCLKFGQGFHRVILQLLDLGLFR